MNIVKRNTYNNNKLEQLLGVNRIGMEESNNTMLNNFDSNADVVTVHSCPFSVHRWAERGSKD